jgi:hypothetical protein
MTKQRFGLVEPVNDLMCLDHLAMGASPARFIGWKLKAKPAEDPEHRSEHYELERVVRVLDDHILALEKAGEIKVVERGAFKSFDEAHRELTPGVLEAEESAAKERERAAKMAAQAAPAPAPSPPTIPVEAPAPADSAPPGAEKGDV